jgi:hypothetical protein
MVQVLVLGIIAALCFWLAPIIAGVTPEKTEAAKENYEKALRDGDKQEALKWGRTYFESLRWHNGYNLTIYDEQRIQNDISVHCNQSNNK